MKRGSENKEFSTLWSNHSFLWPPLNNRCDYSNRCEYSNILHLPNFIFFPRHKIWWQLNSKGRPTQKELHCPKDISGCLYLIPCNTKKRFHFMEAFDFSVLFLIKINLEALSFGDYQHYTISASCYNNKILKISRDIKFLLNTNHALV